MQNSKAQSKIRAYISLFAGIYLIMVAYYFSSNYFAYGIIVALVLAIISGILLERFVKDTIANDLQGIKSEISVIKETIMAKK